MFTCKYNFLQQLKILTYKVVICRKKKKILANIDLNHSPNKRMTIYVSWKQLALENAVTNSSYI